MKSNLVSLCEFAAKRYEKRLKRGQDDRHAWSVCEYDYAYRTQQKANAEELEASVPQSKTKRAAR